MIWLLEFFSGIKKKSK